jgi:hypothetical protein
MKRPAWILSIAAVLISVAIWRGITWFESNFHWGMPEHNTTIEELPPFCVESVYPPFDEHVGFGPRIPDSPTLASPHVQLEELPTAGLWVFRYRPPKGGPEIAYSMRPRFEFGRADVSAWTNPQGQARVLRARDPLQHYSATMKETGFPTGLFPKYFFFAPKYRVIVRFLRDGHPVEPPLRLKGDAYYPEYAWYGGEVFVLRVDRPIHKVVCFLRYAKPE